MYPASNGAGPAIIVGARTPLLLLNQPRVFISYARQDGEAFASELRARLEREQPEITLWQDRTRLEAGVGWWKQITDALDRVEFLLLVMTPAALASPIARKEWRYARLRGVCVYPVKGVSDDALDYQSIPRWMAKAHFFDLTREWDTFIHHLKSPCHATRVPFMAPDLPPSYIARLAPMEQLLGRLLEAGRENPVAITTALHGAGGLGKTTLAAALCHHDSVISAFDDGILWVTLGQKPNLLEALVKLYTALTGERIGFIDTDDASLHLAERLEDKNCLIVIDDVWELEHLAPFLRGASSCTRLITTRHFEIAAEAARVEVDEMTPAEAVQLLTARVDVGSSNLRACRDLTRRLGEWPLLLELANASLRQRIERGDSVSGALQYVSQKLEQQGVTAFDQRNAQARSRALTRTLELSLNQLEAPERVRYDLLAIFPEDLNVPVRQATLVWGCSEFEAVELLQRFDDRSLLKLDLHSATFYVHDVMRAYVLAHLSDVRPAHRRLLDAWRDPHRLPDQYAWRWFAYHLVESDQRDRLRALLVDFEWLTAKLQATDPTALVADLQYIESDGDIKTLEAALRLAAHVLARDKRQLAGQLLGRLPDEGVGALRALRESAGRWRGSPWIRPLEPTLAAPGDALLFTLTGHTSAVRDVVALADGYAISASNDGTLRLWNLERGVEERTFQAHRDWARAVAVSDDKRFLVSTADDQTIRVWDLEQRREHAVIDAPGDWLRTLAIDRVGRQILAAGDGRRITVFDIEQRRPVQAIEGHTGAINAIRLTADGTQIVSASDDRTVRVWDWQSGREIAIWRGHTAKVVAIALTPDDRFVLSVSRDDTIRCWTLRPEPESNGRLITGDAYWSRSVASVDHGRSVVVGSDDASLTVWDISNGAKLRRFEGHADWVNALAATTDGERVISASNDGSLKVWSLRAPPRTRQRRGHSERVRAVVASANGQVVVSTGDDRKLRVWDIAAREERLRLDGQSHWPVAVAPDGAHLVVAAGDATLNVIDVASGDTVGVLNGHTDRIRSVVVAADGARVVSAADDRRIIVWSLMEGRSLLVLPTGRHWVRALAVTPDGNHVISASEDRTLKMWDLSIGAEIRTFWRHEARVNAVGVSRGGLVLSASDDSTVGVWRLDDGALVSTLRGHASGVNGLALHPATDAFATASSDFTVKVWRPGADGALCTYTGETSMTACTIAADGTIVAGDQSGRLHFLHLEGDASATASNEGA
jgi:WD40 repeat protein